MADKKIKNSGKVTHGFGSKRFSGEKLKFYQVFMGIKARCNNKHHVYYSNYGGRGIRCERETFEDFMNDMYESYVKHKEIYGEDTSLDRIDNSKNYSKENCRWATSIQQNSNRRDNANAVVDGKKYVSRDIADMCGICLDGARNRIKNYNCGKITKDELFYKGTLPTHGVYNSKTLAEVDGTVYTCKMISSMCGISIDTAFKRIKAFNMGKMSKESLFKIRLE